MDINDNIAINNKLELAIKDFNIELCLQLIKEGADVNTKYRYNTSLDVAFYFTCQVNRNFKGCNEEDVNYESLYFLVDKGINIHGSDTTLSALFLAVNYSNMKLIKYFIDLGCDVNYISCNSIINYFCNRPIIALTYENRSFCKDVLISKYLIDNGATIYDKNGELFEQSMNKLLDYFDIIEYYKNSNYTGSIKPAKR
jgi:hypothetical protein